MKRHLHFLEPGYRTEEFGCTCLTDEAYEYSLGFTDCWQVFMYWDIDLRKDSGAEYGSTFFHKGLEAKEKCPLHGKEMLVEDIPEDYPWTPSEYIDLR
jgi:hypothetical protein